MAYKITIDFRPGKYPFLMATEADGIKLTKAELESVMAEGERALREYHEYESLPINERAGYAETASEMSYLRRKELRGNWK